MSLNAFWPYVESIQSSILKPIHRRHMRMAPFQCCCSQCTLRLYYLIISFFIIIFPMCLFSMFTIWPSCFSFPHTLQAQALAFFNTSSDSHSCASTILPSSPCQMRSIKTIFFIWLFRWHDGRQIKHSCYFLLRPWDVYDWYMKA